MSRRPNYAPFDIPREVTVRGRRWLVAYDLELGDDKYDARSKMELGRGGHYRGRAHPHNEGERRRVPQREIHLSAFSNRHPWEACSTFLHEAIHAVSSEVDPCQPIGMAAEEKFVHAIEADLLKVLAQLNWKKTGEL